MAVGKAQRPVINAGPEVALGFAALPHESLMWQSAVRDVGICCLGSCQPQAPEGAQSCHLYQMAQRKRGAFLFQEVAITKHYQNSARQAQAAVRYAPGVCDTFKHEGPQVGLL